MGDSIVLELLSALFLSLSFPSWNNLFIFFPESFFLMCKYLSLHVPFSARGWWKKRFGIFLDPLSPDARCRWSLKSRIVWVYDPREHVNHEAPQWKHAQPNSFISRAVTATKVFLSPHLTCNIHISPSRPILMIIMSLDIFYVLGNFSTHFVISPLCSSLLCEQRPETGNIRLHKHFITKVH